MTAEVMLDGPGMPHGRWSLKERGAARVEDWDALLVEMGRDVHLLLAFVASTA